MKKTLLILFLGLSIIIIWASFMHFKKQETKATVALAQEKSASYWTCPMHPQIHAEHPGECPICHMKLVLVKAQEIQPSNVQRAQIQITPQQSTLLGIQRHQVERMNLMLSIPISGRLLSPTSVAFQVYESDLKYIKTGLSFRGVSSIVEEGKITGVVTSVDSMVDPTSRTIRVLGSIKKTQSSLITETTFSGVVEVELKNRISIPESAVLHTGSGDLVYLFQDDNQIKAQEVRLGQKTEGFFEVLSGLEPGQYISSGPNFLLDSEAKIRGTSDQKTH